MIRSMTGFGDMERETSGGRLHVEIRTENHRHFHTHFRLPAEAERWETELTRILRERISRGHVRFRLDFEPGEGTGRPLEVDHARAAAYLAAMDEIERRHGSSLLNSTRRALRRLFRGVDAGLLLRLGDVLRPAEDVEGRIDEEALFAATREALEKVAGTRAREGEALARDLLESVAAIETALRCVEERAPERLTEERDRLRAAVSELSAGAGLDEDRLAKEVAFLAERWDINEEIVRLRSHLSEFRSLVDGEDSDPVGKRLGFWVKEMLRESNTVGSKANDSEIARQVVEMKTAIEKIREQVENVE